MPPSIHLPDAGPCEIIKTALESQINFQAEVLKTKTGYYVFSSRGIEFIPNREGQCSSLCLEITGDASHLEILRKQVGEERFVEIMSLRDGQQREDAAFTAMLQSSELPFQYDESPAATAEAQAMSQELWNLGLNTPVPTPLLQRLITTTYTHGLNATDLRAHFKAQMQRYRANIPQFRVQNADLKFRTGKLPMGEPNVLIERTIEVEFIHGDVSKWLQGEDGQSMQILMGDLATSMHLRLYGRINRLISLGRLGRMPYTAASGRNMRPFKYSERAADLRKGYIVYRADDASFRSGKIEVTDHMGQVLRSQSWSASDLP